MAELYFDATDQIVGRMASQIAKAALKGNKVFVVNAEKAVISGSKEVVFGRYKAKTQRGDPYHGPFYPKTPDRMIKRSVRGMMPKKPHGRDAFKDVRIYLSVPTALEGKKFESLKQSQNNLECKFISLGALCEILTGKKYN